MRSALMAMCLALAACGPQTEDPTTQGTSSSTSDGSTSSADTIGAASTEIATAAEASTAGSSDDTAGLLVPADGVVTSVICQKDGTVDVLFEVFLDGLEEACSPAPDEGLDTLLLIGLADWDGQAGTLEIGAPGVNAQYGLSVEVTGTITLEVSEPTFPSAMTLDLVVPGTTVEGELDLVPCRSHFDGACEPTKG